VLPVFESAPPELVGSGCVESEQPDAHVALWGGEGCCPVGHLVSGVTQSIGG
jgi:hypothetical protein